MQAQQVCLSKEEIALRGREIYDDRIRQKVESNDDGKIVAIDVVTSEFVVRDNSLNAADALLENYPDAQIWFVRVGHRAVHRIGFAGSTLVSLEQL